MLRVLARGGSLGDALRRVVQHELVLLTGGLDPVAVIGGGLPVQLPRRTLVQVSDLADQTGCGKILVVRSLLQRGLARSKDCEELWAGHGST